MKRDRGREGKRREGQRTKGTGAQVGKGTRKKGMGKRLLK